MKNNNFLIKTFLYYEELLNQTFSNSCQNQHLKYLSIEKNVDFEFIYFKIEESADFEVLQNQDLQSMFKPRLISRLRERHVEGKRGREVVCGNGC